MIYGIYFFITTSFMVETDNQFSYEKEELITINCKQIQNDTTDDIYDVVEQNAFYNGAVTQP